MNNPWGCLREERIRCEGGAGWDGERGEVDFSVEVILRELTKTGSHPVALRRRLVEAEILLVQIVDRGVLDMDIPSALA